LEKAVTFTTNRPYVIPTFIHKYQLQDIEWESSGVDPGSQTPQRRKRLRMANQGLGKLTVSRNGGD
jgi:hypothetical protein